MPTLTEDLRFRGIVHQVTDEAIFDRLDRGGVKGAGVALENAAGGRGMPVARDEDVLVRHGHAQQGAGLATAAAFVGRTGLRQGDVGAHVEEGIEPAMALDTVQEMPGELDGLDVCRRLTAAAPDFPAPSRDGFREPALKCMASASSRRYMPHERSCFVSRFPTRF